MRNSGGGIDSDNEQLRPGHGVFAFSVR